MVLSPEFRDYVLEMLEPLGGVTARRMFGGAGLYRDGTIFALVAGDVLYFKVDDANRADYEAAGTGPFRPFEDKPFAMPYWEVPADILEDPAEICAWAAKAWEAGRRAGPPPKRRRRQP
ncbi:TfoX/Sxy family protein [Shumkonia mesophila]|uniref:TfoX/Sxy family protein n=1 Tax=Shumkonia mesophila TaxID=2838854 RepID=UPI00293471EB|nr:TfoX/Sxy family protein [Shumkonia mesophila]